MNHSNGSGRPEPYIHPLLQTCESSMLPNGTIVLHLDTIQPTTLPHSPLATFPDPRWDDMEAVAARSRHDPEDVERWCS